VQATRPCARTWHAPWLGRLFGVLMFVLAIPLIFGFVRKLGG
jgi:hypothetical protein